MSVRRNLKLLIAGTALAALGTVAGYILAHHNMTPIENQTIPTSQKSTASSERRVLYWYDPMKPDQHFDKPGKSPFMDMELVPMYAEEGKGQTDSGVRIDPRLLQNTGVKYAFAEKGRLDQDIQVVGTLAFNDRMVTVVQARTAGLVEKVYYRAPNDVIPTGAPLVDMRVPEWYGAQEEYLALQKAGEVELSHAARMRLIQLGMTEEQVIQVEKSGSPRAVLTITTPQSGVLQELDVRSGMTIMPGQTLARINGIGTVWLDAEVPEAITEGLAVGQQVTAGFTSWPGKIFAGRVSALLPVLERDTRTLRVRIEWPNPKGLLRPGMYARVNLRRMGTESHLLVPTDAVISTGQRNVVIIAGQDGHFIPAAVKPGRESRGKTEIISGLKEGERVVVSGQFLIDSEANLKGVLARMEKSESQQ